MVQLTFINSLKSFVAYHVLLVLQFLPPSSHKTGSRNDRFSGLWEFYFDTPPSNNEGAGSDEDTLKNIRGFLLKRRKSPLKGWHKVSQYIMVENVCTHMHTLFLIHLHSSHTHTHTHAHTYTHTHTHMHTHIQRYFVLERGILYFSRTQAQIAKGKALGSLDVGVAFVHADGSTRRIDIDGEHVVVHLKV